jgi:chaperonin GroES
VDSTGDDLKKSIYPLPVREPSQVLFQLLGLLINYTQRISGSTDTLAGENPGQNTPATTTNAMIEQGMKIYNAIYKRVWRSMKEEFKKLYMLNRTFLPMVTSFGEGESKVLREDYLGDPNRISPVADPSITSEQQRMQQATALKQAAMSTPGYNLPEVERNYLRALHIDGWESMYPGPEKMPPPKNPKVVIEEMKMQTKQMGVQADMQKFAANLMEQRRLNSAKILQLEAQAAKLIAEADGVQTGHEIAAFEAAIGALKTHDESLRGGIELMMKSMEPSNETTNRTGMAGMEAAPVQ